MPKKKMTISVHEDRCSGCQRCALACSFYTTPGKTFNLSKSKIMVMPSWDLGHFEIRIGDDCIRCGRCVEYCEFSALEQG